MLKLIICIGLLLNLPSGLALAQQATLTVVANAGITITFSVN